MIVGEAPGGEEDKAGRPFVGRSGQLLREELSRVGLNPEDCYITNTVKCRPPDNAKPKAGDIKACRKYLDEEMASVKPEYIITLGSLSTKAILKKAKITEVHGQITALGKTKAMAAFHPAYCLRDPSKLPSLRKDLKRMADEILGREKDKRATFTWREINEENISEFFAELEKCEWFSFDLETSGLDWFNPFERWVSCLNMSFDNGGGSWVLPMTMPFSSYPSVGSQEYVIRKISERLHFLKKKGCAHNGKFDNHWLKAVFDVIFPLQFDTMLASHAADENRAHDLKSLATYYLDAPYYDIPLHWKQGRFKPNERTKANVRTTYRYGAKDSYYTLCMRPIMEKEVRRDPQVWRLFQRLIMRAATVFGPIEENGLYILRDEFAVSRKRVVKDRDLALVTLNKMVEKKLGKPINWNSPPQVAHLLFDVLKLPVIEKTKGGVPSTGEATLVALKDKHPIANQLVKYRELDKFLGTYLDGWKSLMRRDLVYFSYKLHGTVTGRYSSRLHQTPRDGTIRNTVSAPPGWTFVQGDFSQAELRVAAILSGDLELLHCFKHGIDVHWRTLLYVVQSGGAGEYVKPAIKTASKISGRKVQFNDAIDILQKAGHEAAIKIWPGWKEARKKAKGINFGFLYSMRELKFIGYAKLKYGFEPTWDEAHALRTAYFQLYRGLEPWHERMKKLAHLDGYVRSLSGRLRRLPGIMSSDRSVRSECERQAINSPVQGFIGDFKAMALVELAEKLDPARARVVGEVHDSILFWVRTELLEVELPKIAKIMQNPELVKEFNIDLSVPIDVELEVGPWGKGVKWIPKAA
jgi:DNA polymerase-1